MYNKSILIGRLTANPELKSTPNGVSVLRVCIAVPRAFISSNNERLSDFINITAWRQTAEFIAKYFSKGKLIGIEGSIQTGKFTDKEGATRYTFEVGAERAFFTESKGSVVGNTEGTFNPPSADGFQLVDDDDLPF